LKSKPLIRELQMHLIIATHQRPGLLDRTLNSLGAAHLPGDFNHVLVIENGGSSVARKICEKAKIPVAHHFLPQPGRSQALNYALEKIGAGFCVVLDDDMRVSPGFLKAYSKAIDLNPGPNVFGGPIEIDYEGPPPPDWLLRYLPASAVGFKPQPGGPFLGGNFGFFAEDALKIGGFDPQLGTGALGSAASLDPLAEELRLQKSLAGAGARLIPVPDALAWHYVPEDRCSPRWALERQARQGFTEGSIWARAPKGRRAAGVPLWIWRQLGSSIPGWVASSIFPKGQLRFRTSYELYHATSFIKGIRHFRSR
jgi:cellulose synthase/poly-beta-1,6-N-acetylglucosamine synthase-like glycosyltransferase